MEELFEKKARVEAEIGSLIAQGARRYEQFRPLLDESSRLDKQIDSRRRMLTKLVIDMLGEVESHFQAGRTAPAAELLGLIDVLAGLIHEERVGRWEELAEGLAAYQRNRDSAAAGLDLMAEFSKITS
jgi:hypothetical protein